MSAKKRAVLDAAARLLAQNPRASTGDIAAAARISRATLHRLFPSREILIEELGMAAADQIGAAFAEARLEEGSVVAALERLVGAVIPLVHQFAYLIAEIQLAQSERMTAADRKLQHQIERLMRRGQREGSLRTDLPIAWLAHSLAGLLVAAEEAVRLGSIAPRDASTLVLESFLGGAARPNDPFAPSSFGQLEAERMRS